MAAIIIAAKQSVELLPDLQDIDKLVEGKDSLAVATRSYLEACNSEGEEVVKEDPHISVASQVVEDQPEAFKREVDIDK